MAWLAGFGAAQAATIRLDDDTALQGDVVESTDEHVYIRLPRERVASVNGRPLPAILKAGAPAPTVTITDLQGQTHTVGAAADRVAVLFFWTSWCPYCRVDAPKMQALYEQYKDDPRMTVLAISLDQDRSKLDQYVREQQLTLPVALAGGPAADGTDVAQLYQIDGFPVTFLIDARGIIRRKIQGSFVRQDVDLAAEAAALLPAH